MQQLLIVYNPASGRKRAQPAWHALQKRLPDFTTRLLNIRTERPSLPEALAHADVVAVVGGDGTVRTVVQTIQDGGRELPVAIVPRGSANLIARTLHLPFSVRSAAHLIRARSLAHVDIAKLDTGEYLVGACAVGYLSERITETKHRLKKMFGFGSYLWSMVRARRLPLYRFQFTADNTIATDTGHSLFIINASNLFGVHSRHVMSIHDGYFELGVTKNRSLLSFAALVHDFYFRQAPPRHFTLVRGKRFEIHCPEPLSLLLDGEPFPPVRDIGLTVQQNRQPFIVLRRYSDSRR